MAITPEQHQLLISSFSKLNENPGLNGGIIFHYALTEFPELKEVFWWGKKPFPDGIQNDKNVQHHGKNVLGLVGKCIDMIGNDEALIEAIYKAGVYHKTKKTLPEHFPKIGVAIVNMLSEVLAEDFTEECKGAWLTLYGIVSEHMIRGLES